MDETERATATSSPPPDHDLGGRFQVLRAPGGASPRRLAPFSLAVIASAIGARVGLDVIRVRDRLEHLALIASELGMVRSDLAGSDPLEQHDRPTIRVVHLRESALVIGHAHSLVNRSEETARV